MAILRKATNRIRASVWWVKALKLAAHSRHAVALDLTDRIEKVGFTFPCELQILRGFLQHALGMHMKSYATLRNAISMLKSSKHYTENERRYLEFYSLSIIKDISDTYGPELEKTKVGEILFEIPYSKVDLESAPKNFKKNFPLTDHPEWVN